METKNSYQIVYEIPFDGETSNLVFAGITELNILTVLANCTDVMLKAFEAEDFKIVNVIYQPLKPTQNES